MKSTRFIDCKLVETKEIDFICAGEKPPRCRTTLKEKCLQCNHLKVTENIAKKNKLSQEYIRCGITCLKGD